ncbi:MAG: DUF2461 domain-containing protein [Bacteroidetes bacterium]|nr:DUF2461 domain-containing protein [Bacteroidota bacterium]
MTKEVLQFLEALAQNNNREWFEKNRNRYESARNEAIDLAEKIIGNLALTNPGYGSLDPRKCIFRIYRDVRFSQDKSPYKTHIGMFFNAGGKTAVRSGYYVHIEPGKSFIGGGVYGPPAPELKALRQEIYFHSAEFRAIIDNTQFRAVFGDLMEEKLSRPPKGFPADFNEIELLKYKHYVVGHDLNDVQVSDPGLVDRIMHTFNTMRAFNEFLNRALEPA